MILNTTFLNAHTVTLEGFALRPRSELQVDTFSPLLPFFNFASAIVIIRAFVVNYFVPDTKLLCLQYGSKVFQQFLLTDEVLGAPGGEATCPGSHHS